MKIVVLIGCTNALGATSILVDNFHKGAAEAGHGVEVVDAASKLRKSLR